MPPAYIFCLADPYIFCPADSGLQHFSLYLIIKVSMASGKDMLFDEDIS